MRVLGEIALGIIVALGLMAAVGADIVWSVIKAILKRGDHG